jgi:hypothetical protein
MFRVFDERADACVRARLELEKEQFSKKLGAWLKQKVRIINN